MYKWFLYNNSSVHKDEDYFIINIHTSLQRYLGLGNVVLISKGAFMECNSIEDINKNNHLLLYPKQRWHIKKKETGT